MTVPTFRMFDVRGQWFAEGHGVDPDILVEEDPSSLAKGIDPQLERAIDELKKRMSAQPARPARPAPEKRVPWRPRRPGAHLAHQRLCAERPMRIIALASGSTTVQLHVTT